MRKTWVLAGAAVLVTVSAIGGAAVMSSAKQATPATQEPPANTMKVEKGKLSAIVSLYGTLTYRARSDGSPYSVINQARGTYTQLPDDGDTIGCGDVFYRVDDHPVLLLCGTVPAYRHLYTGDKGNDVRQLNQNLHKLGYDAGANIEPDDIYFTSKTAKALEVLQYDKGFDVTGELNIDDAVFLPEPVRVAKVTGELGASAQPSVQVLSATSDTLEVQVALEATQQGEVKQGDLAQITLPGNKPVTGKVDRFGSIAQVPAGKNDNAGAATIPAYISLDDPEKASGLDEAPVQVEITTAGVENVLSVPVTALVGKSGGGFAVEVVHAGGRREMVAVKPGLFGAGGRVEVEGDLREGDLVVVPSL
jgi:peptidoglycan hydrolase-like protein with peptidoglycan-binding domain